MIPTKRRLYPLLLLLTALGYVWLLTADGQNVLGCPVRLVLGIPCPACGTTRAVLALAHGEWLASLRYNPLGLPVAAGLLLVPLWIGADWLRGSDSLLRAYCLMEKKLRQWPYAALGIMALLINWIWNLTK